ncbi:MAG TPA: penicillin-binding transpeptidase domain-containing protein [Candidatus Paceibacterota bacterium]
MFNRRRKNQNQEIDPDEIFLDSSNLPEFDVHQLEGRIEKPIPKRTLYFLASFFVLVCAVFVWKTGELQLIHGEGMRALAENNRLRHEVSLAERGVIFDRNGIELVWNEPFSETGRDFARRKYSAKAGLAHLLGYIQYPARDSSGFFYREQSLGKDGVELFYDSRLAGENGLRLIETNALTETESAGFVEPAVPGENITLAIDAELQEKLHHFIQTTANSVGFGGGAGVLLDVHTGEVLALTSYPEFRSEVLTEGSDDAAIQRSISDPRKPFLNRATSGLYIPGSIIKPFLALGALNEQIISPEKTITSFGFISIPNPFDPANPTIIKDWRAHGETDMRRALAVSSDVYFFSIGGGYEGQKGLGIQKIDAYMRLFGFGEETGIDLHGEVAGTIPTPAWKKEVFGEEWRIGDTYNAAIGQYGFQVTPVQVASAIAAIANDGTLFAPSILKISNGKNTLMTADFTIGNRISYKRIPIAKDYFQIVREGMRKAVTEGTAAGLNIPGVAIAGKTGTAELGAAKQFVNSWVTGFFPYEKPRYAFAIVMERGPRANLVGATYVARQLFDWMVEERPEYLKDE